MIKQIKRKRREKKQQTEKSIIFKEKF